MGVSESSGGYLILGSLKNGNLSSFGFAVEFGSFRKLRGVPYFGVLRIWILLFGVLDYLEKWILVFGVLDWGPLFPETPRFLLWFHASSSIPGRP